MAEDDQKDFYISHDEEDREWADWIAWHLEKMGGYTCINPSWDFLAGSNIVHNVHEAVQQAKCTLAVLSPNYLKSSSTQAEWKAALYQDPTGKSGKLLPILVSECELQGLLAPIVPVDLKQCDVQTALRRLLTGVQRIPVRPSVPPPYPGADISEGPIFPRKNVLIASLGDSPAVVSSMYDQLTKQLPEQEKLSIDRLVVLCPENDEDDDVKYAFEQVKRALSGRIAKDRLIYHPLRLKDANSWKDCCAFLQDLYRLLSQHQEKGDTVYLSLAGGRKSMAALMAWVVPFFPCIEKLYHIIDEDESNFLSSWAIGRLRDKQFESVMHPPADGVKLVNIPFEKGKLLSQDMHEKLINGPVYKLEEIEVELVEASINDQIARQKGRYPLDVCLTREAERQFKELYEQNKQMARTVKNGLLTMSELNVLLKDMQQAGEEADTTHAKLDGSKNATRLLRYFNGLEVPVRPVFYTDPNELADYRRHEVERVVICSLEQEKSGRYRTLQEVKSSDDFTTTGIAAAIDLYAPPEPVDSVLIVPLGNTPMVATQLYTLLENHVLRTIRELVLIYPEQSQSITNGVNIIERMLPLLSHEVRCEKAVVKGYEDIVCSKACSDFQQVVEDQIQRVRESVQYRGCTIDLALSGGRKGMTAMTIFAAHQKKIPFVYHTLIPDKRLRQKIEDETNLEKLSRMSPEKQFKYLFLDEYRLPADPPSRYSRFKLFRVPVFPLEN